VLLPVGTRSVWAAARQHDDFAAVTALNVPTAAAFRAAYVKSACVAECAALGIPCPEVHPRSRARALLAGGGAVTLVVKPDIDVGGAAGVEYVRTPAELDAALARCTRRFGGALIQEYIPGGPDAMKTVILLFGPDASLAAAFTARKLRQWPPAGGTTGASCSTRERDLVDLVLPFFRKWRWRGAAEAEFKLDARDGRHKLIEINPRFPAYLRFAAHCGLDLPLLAARLALGETDAAPEPFDYRAGAHFVNPKPFLHSALHDLRQCGDTAAVLRECWRQLDGTGPLLRYMLGDPLPMVGRVLRDALRPAAARSLFLVER
jgi:predicted ATP-grasp superfamily ATP-dependent carboligase